MNAGELKDRISLMELKQVLNTYSWEQATLFWAKAEPLKENNIFSKVGLSTKSIKFKVRKNSSLSLHNAFRWKGKHCFLTNITETDPMFLEITAALIEPYTCTVERTGQPTLDNLNRPVYGDSNALTFPGCLTEKYLGHVQGEPMTSVEARYVLVTPKTIILSTGELVTINNIPYTVLIPHTLDIYKNEYEIGVKGDA